MVLITAMESMLEQTNYKLGRLRSCSLQGDLGLFKISEVIHTKLQGKVFQHGPSLHSVGEWPACVKQLADRTNKGR